MDSAGDKVWLSSLGIALGKHPGFDGPRGSKQGLLSAYFANLADAAADDADWAQIRVKCSPLDVHPIFFQVRTVYWHHLKDMYVYIIYTYILIFIYIYTCIGCIGCMVV